MPYYWAFVSLGLVILAPATSRLRTAAGCFVGFRASGLGLRLKGVGLTAQGPGFRVQSLGLIRFRVQDLGLGLRV